MLKRIGVGAFSEVFELTRDKVLKAFRDIPPTGFEDADVTVIPRVMYSAELALFERIRDHAALEIYLPRFYNVADPRWYNLDSREGYSSGCGLVMERCPGQPRKLAEVPPDLADEVDRVVSEIKECTGVDDPWDGSCFIPGSRAPFTLIDIATPTERLCLIDELMTRDGEILPTSHAALGIRMPSGESTE